MPIYLGTTTPSKYMVGATAAKRIYRGTAQVWPTYNPLSIPWSIALWADDPGQVKPADGTNLTTWRQAGNLGSAWALITGAGYYVRYYASAINGRAAVGFYTGGGNPGMFGSNWPTPPYTGSFTVVAIGTRTPHASSTFTLVSGSNGPRFQRGPTSQPTRAWKAGMGTSVIMNPTMTADTAAHLLTAWWPNSSPANQAYFKVDGVLEDNATYTSVERGGTHNLWLGDSTAGASTWFIGFVGIIGRELTTQEQADLLNWSRPYYGTP